MVLLDLTTVLVDSVGRASFKALVIGKDMTEAYSTNNNDVRICLCICICITVVVLAMLISLAIYCICNKNQNCTTNDSKEGNNDRASLQPKEKEVSPQEKERKEFINFCYEMARSKEDKDATQKKECWEFLKETFTDEKTIKGVE